MPNESGTTYAVAFFDGQNLFQHAKAAFGHFHPNYDPRGLARLPTTGLVMDTRGAFYLRNASKNVD